MKLLAPITLLLACGDPLPTVALPKLHEAPPCAAVSPPRIAIVPDAVCAIELGRTPVPGAVCEEQWLTNPPTQTIKRRAVKCPEAR